MGTAVTQRLEVDAISGSTIWNTATVANIDDGTQSNRSAGGDSNSIGNTTVDEWQAWELQDITPLSNPNAFLWELNIFVQCATGALAKDAKIKIGGAEYTASYVNSTVAGSYTWMSYRVKIGTGVGLTAAITDATVHVQSESSTTVHCIFVEAIKCTNCVILRPTGNHADNDYGDWTKQRDPVVWSVESSQLDTVEKTQQGKTTVVTYNIMTVESAPTISGVTVDDYLLIGVSRPDVFYRTTDQGTRDGTGPESRRAYNTDGSSSKVFYSAYWNDGASNLDSGLSGLAIGWSEGTLANGESGSSNYLAYLQLNFSYDSDTADIGSIVPTSNGTGGDSYADIDNTIASKTDSGSTFTGNQTKNWGITNSPIDCITVSGLRLELYTSQNGISTDFTTLETVQLMESDGTTAISELVTLERFSTTVNSLRTIDLPLSGTLTKAVFDTAVIQLKSVEVGTVTTQTVIVKEIEITGDYSTVSLIGPIVPSSNGTLTSGWDNINNGVDNYDDAFTTNLSGGSAGFFKDFWFPLTNMPDNFGHILTAEGHLRSQFTPAGTEPNSPTIKEMRVYREDETTALTAYSTGIIQTSSFVTNSRTMSITGDTGKAAWDDAAILIRAEFQGDASGGLSISEFELKITYSTDLPGDNDVYAIVLGLL